MEKRRRELLAIPEIQQCFTIETGLGASAGGAGRRG
jgi:hypothetical protein